MKEVMEYVIPEVSVIDFFPCAVICSSLESDGIEDFSFEDWTD